MNTSLQDAIQDVSRRQKSTLWLVGGPIRDALLGRPCDDWDLVCRGAQKMAKSVAKVLRAKFITLDEQHKIYRVILTSSSLRTGEGYPSTLDFAEIQGRTIGEDLSRRDFTINAMAQPLTLHPPATTRDWGAKGNCGSPGLPGERAGVRGIIDPHHGQQDLKRGILRAVSMKAFKEDPLRLLRAFRFSAQFDLKIESRTLRGIQNQREALGDVSAERIREELLRLWKQPCSHKALRLMDRSKLLSIIFPEIEACRRTAVRFYGSGGVLKHSLQTVENLEWILERSSDPSIRHYINELVGGYPRVAWLKLAAFLHDIGKPGTAKMLHGRLRFFGHEHTGAALAAKIGQRLRCSRQEVHLLGMWVRGHMRLGNLAAASRITDKAVSRYFRDLGEDGVGMVLVSLADHYTYLSRNLWGKGTDPVEKMSRNLLSSYFQERSKILPERLVNGHELMRALRLKPGPMIGKLLEDLQDAQAEGKVSTREQAFAYAKKRLRKR